MALFTFSPEVLKYFYALLKIPCLSPEAAAFQCWSDVIIPSRDCNWFSKLNTHSRIFSGRAVNKHPAFLLSNMSSLDHSLTGLKIPQPCHDVLQNDGWARIFISQQGSREMIRDLSCSPQKYNRTVCKHRFDSSDSTCGDWGVLLEDKPQCLVFGRLGNSGMIRKGPWGIVTLGKRINYPETRNE